MMRKLKYHDRTCLLSDCPPAVFARGSRKAFRLIFAAAGHPDSYRPPAIINPSRKWESEPEHCGAYALSLFVTGEALVKRMLGLEGTFKQLRKRLGDQIAVGAIVHSDGEIDEPDEDGHFNLHEYPECDLSAKFKWFAALPPT